MPYYFSEIGAEREELEMWQRVMLLDAMIGELVTRYPYLDIDTSINVDPDKQEQIFRKKYTYWTNRVYEDEDEVEVEDLFEDEDGGGG